MLLKAGANVYKHDIGKQTPLILAAIEEQVDVLNLIIDAASQHPTLLDSYIHHKDHEGSTALYLAVVNNQFDNVKMLLDAGADVNHAKDDQMTALHFAAMFGFQEIASLLIEKGADVHCETDIKQTPLHKAALYDDKTDVAEILISHGADVNAVDKQEMTPLHCAVGKAQLKMTKFLINHGAAIEQADIKGKTILHFAVESQKLECLEMLVKNISKETLESLLHSKDLDEMTPLHYSAKSGKLNILLRLLELGSSPAAKNELDKTPIHIAADSKSEINDDDADGRTPLLFACLHGHYNCVKTLLRFGADVKARGRNECCHTPLTLAASRGHLELVDLLLDNGAPTEAVTKFRDTSLHLACKDNWVKVVNLLLSRQVDVTARNVRDETPLDVAIKNGSTDSADAIIKSNRWKEAMNCKDSYGINPLPHLIAYMPSVANSVLDKCVIREGSPEDKDFAVTYDFSYLDPHPDDNILCTKRHGKAWFVNDISEHDCHDLLTHELTQASLYLKWNKFGKISFFIDFVYYLSVVIILSSYVTIIPNHSLQYVDVSGCPIIVTDEEANNQTILDALQQNGTLDRFPQPSSRTVRALHVLRIITLTFLAGTAARFITSIVYLRWLFFQKINTYCTMAMCLCVVIAIIQLDMTTLIACTSQKRATWMGILISWFLLIGFLIRMPVIGLYLSMFIKVCNSVVKAMLVLVIIFIGYAYYFFITLGYLPEFSNPFLSVLSVFNMALGETSFVENFIVNNKGPLYYDNLFLIFTFMMGISIALVNLLIGIAVGDIDAIRSASNITLIKLQIKTVDEYGRFAMRWLQLKWYEDSITVYPNRPSQTCLTKIACLAVNWVIKVTNRSVYQRATGWEYQSRLQPVVDTVEVLSAQLEQTQKSLREMQAILDHHNELLQAIAGKVGAELDKRGKFVDA
ncbi:hypothetical protein EB796_021893 [Bugula neritina]|uniref:TRPA1 n=1 Tax=Bugula neritina TaxID=10212 RepID=A0A7J7J117_BUGNE|nr:hypothetical protein EB796_021893 [Bugula neritina]